VQLNTKISNYLSAFVCSPPSHKWQATTSTVPLLIVTGIAVSCCQLTPHRSPSQ